MCPLPPPTARPCSDLSQQEAVPVLAGERQDFSLKIEIFLLATNAQVIQDEVGHVHPKRSQNLGKRRPPAQARTSTLGKGLKGLWG